ncbi:MAG: efflux RND transporter periplasmic adaptor subunit [bacterium]|nr:efflux RND transporter periplasmic adaptor subunit [bacterium]
MNKTLLSLLLIVAALGLGGGLAWLMVRTPPVPPETDMTIPPPLVQTVRVAPETVIETIVGHGTARADRVALLTAEVGGQIVEIGRTLQDGSPVEAGQLLARIDDRQYAETLELKTALAAADQAALDQLVVEEANLNRLLEIAEREVKVNRDEERRLADLFEQENASKREYDVARLAYTRSLRERTAFGNQVALIPGKRTQLAASLRSRQADVALAQLDVDRCRITAPFTGRIDELLMEMGEAVQPSGQIARIIDLSRIEIPIELPVSSYARVAVGADVVLLGDSMTDLSWSGRVERISPAADARSRTFRAYVMVDNERQDPPWGPGLFVRAEVAGPALVDALLVPRGALVEGHLFVVNDDHAHRREVQVERYLGERALVTGQLRHGDAVIVTNLDSIEDGLTVRTRGETP